MQGVSGHPRLWCGFTTAFVYDVVLFLSLEHKDKRLQIGRQQQTKESSAHGSSLVSQWV